MLWRDEYSFRLFVWSGAAVIACAWYIHLSPTNFLLILFLTGAVLAVEALNTAIEELCDHVTPEEHPNIGKVKDIASGATLIMLITAATIGAVIFIRAYLGVA